MVTSKIKTKFTDSKNIEVRFPVRVYFKHSWVRQIGSEFLLFGRQAWVFYDPLRFALYHMAMLTHKDPRLIRLPWNKINCAIVAMLFFDIR